MKKNVLKFRQSGGIAKSLLILCIVVFLSCQKKMESEVIIEKPDKEEKDSIITDSIVTTKLMVNLMAVEYEDEKKLHFENNFLVKGGNRMLQNADDKKSDVVTLDLANNYYVIASLKAEEQQVTSPLVKGLAIEYENIKYKVVVFDEKGNYISHHDFVNKKGRNNELGMLEAGKAYTFIVYSTNSVADLPNLVFEDSMEKNLKTANVILRANEDLLYYRKDWILPATKENNLAFNLKHVFSEITTTIDATATGYPINEIKSNYTSLNRNTTVSLANLQTKSLNKVNASLTFPTLNHTNKIISSLPMVINSGKTISFKIPSIKIGLLTFSNISSIDNFEIKPGVKYSLNLKIFPDDNYLTHRGVPAARINGIIWMRHNLGVNIHLDPDVNKMIVDYHGNYYQWGRDFASASGNDMNATIFSVPIGLKNEMWYPGTDNAPKKGEFDPCPEGFRIPTGMEYLRLINYTTATNIGEFRGEKRWHTQYPTDFSVAKVLTSMRNSQVKLIFPAQGIMDVGFTGYYWDNGILGRAGAGAYHASSAVDKDVYSTHFYFDATTVSLVENRSTSNDRIAKLFSMNIRCIAE